MYCRKLYMQISVNRDRRETERNLLLKLFRCMPQQRMKITKERRKPSLKNYYFYVFLINKIRLNV